MTMKKVPTKPMSGQTFVVVRGILGQPIKLGAFSSDDEKTPAGQLYAFDEASFFDLRNAYQFGRQEELEQLWDSATKISG